MSEYCPYCIAGYAVEVCLFDKVKGCFGDGEELSTVVPEGMGSDSERPSDTEEKVFKDAVSTGRKRAAVLYPIQIGQVCEWAWSKNCGGGIDPIVGCTGRPATNIHHGPDKSVLNNDRSNISIICEFCHNRWHVANDGFYINPRPANGATWLPDPELVRAGNREYSVKKLEERIKASKVEILANEALIPEGGKDRQIV